MSSWKSLDEIPMYPEEEKGFEIKCLNCGSIDCEITFEGSGAYSTDMVIVCHNCGQNQ